MGTQSSDSNINKKMSRNDCFKFDCGPHAPCFTECCGKLDLTLTPYDALRLKKGLGLSSEDFMEKHTTLRTNTTHGFPEVMMQMNMDDQKRCPFVTEKGCSIYSFRPGACRTYPLGRAATKHPLLETNEEFFFTVREDHCRGFQEDREWTVDQWLDDQDLNEYNRVNDLLMELYVLRARGKGQPLTPQHIQMFMMACYNTEKFRDFIFKSGFLTKFELDDELVERLREDGPELLEFAFTWLKFALFQQPVLKVRDDIRESMTK